MGFAHKGGADDTYAYFFHVICSCIAAREKIDA
jgi:hypothetical protein